METIFILREIERMIVVGGSLFFGYLGYRLFIFGVTTGNSRMQAESRWLKFAFSGTGPGLLFMAFGSIVMVTSLLSPLSDAVSEIKNASGGHNAGATTPLGGTSNVVSVRRERKLGGDSEPEIPAKEQEAPSEWNVGDKVAITGGPFENFEGVVEDIEDSGEIAFVVVNIFGRSTTIEVPADNLEKVEPMKEIDPFSNIPTNQCRFEIRNRGTSPLGGSIPSDGSIEIGGHTFSVRSNILLIDAASFGSIIPGAKVVIDEDQEVSVNGMRRYPK